MIFVRSPYIVKIDEALQEATKLELYIWNGATGPAEPTYVLSKKIPSSNNTATYYNISPFLREFINFNDSVADEITNNNPLNIYTYCNFGYNTYKIIDGEDILVDSVEDVALDGYGYFENGGNPTNEILGNYLLSDVSIKTSENIYYYPCSDGLNSKLRAGALSILSSSDCYAVYTRLDDFSSIVVNLYNNSLINVLKVHPDNYDVGNKLEIFNESEAGDDLLATYYFVPQCECRYEPVTIDFVNRYGAWQRTWFYKASNETIEVSNTAYNLMPSVLPEYNTLEGQRHTFNTNAKQSFKLNSGFVNEQFKITLQELMLSEVIRVNGFPAMLKTKSVEKYKEINQKTINYTLEFEMAYDLINSIS